MPRYMASGVGMSRNKEKKRERERERVTVIVGQCRGILIRGQIQIYSGYTLNDP